jgi:predicted DNA-binding protein YlxM (UPF0122 family)
LTVSNNERMIGKVTRISVLYDFYASLLTSRQREMIELHYFDDWSLGEIATHVGVSRQAVHDNLRRSEDQLEGYEAALQLLLQHEIDRHAQLRFATLWETTRKFVPDALRVQMDALIMEWAPRGESGTGRDSDA